MKVTNVQFIIASLLVGMIGLMICHIASDRVVLPDVVEEVKPGVVHIRNISGRCQGSGFFIADDVICTARHVIEGSTNFEITTDANEVIKATKALAQVDSDIGFILLDRPVKNAKVMQVRPISECRVGDEMFAIGSPYGDINTNHVSKGVLSAKNKNYDRFGKDYGWSVAFATDTAGHPGNSGCPVFSMDGKVRGVLVGSHSPVLIYCMPSELFLWDAALVKMMFNMMKYKRTTEATQLNYMNPSNGTEYYE